MSDRQTRREFMGLTASGMAGFLTRPRLRDVRATLSALLERNPDPDLVVINARVYTMDPTVARAEAFAVGEGRFTAVGSTADMRALATSRTRVMDAKGMTVVPGFTDCHNHAGGTLLLYEVMVGNPFEVEFVTIQSIVDKLRARAGETPPGAWVNGYFFDDTKLKDQRPLTRHDLDKASVDHPIAVAIRRSTTPGRSSSRVSRATHRIPPAARSIATRMAISPAA